MELCIELELTIIAAIFAAECSPPKLRGALVMQWQMWTGKLDLTPMTFNSSNTNNWIAFGIMVGYVADLAFYFVPDMSGIIGLNWRLMMGSAGIPAVIVCVLIWWTPESPRWYLTKNRHAEAYKSVCQLRYEKVQAARDLFYMDTLLQVEREAMNIGRSKVLELFTVRRNRNAMIASEIVSKYNPMLGSLNPRSYVKTRLVFCFQCRQLTLHHSVHATVLRRQRHCLLLDPNLH